VAFWADAQTDPAIRQAVVDLAQADGYPVTDLAGLEPAGLSSPVRLVVAVLNTPDQQNAFRVLAENNPEGTFLALGSGSFEDLSNVVSLSSNTEQSAFVGGMIAAMVSTDWRVGLLNQTGLPESSADRDAFINGAIYFCGICTSKYGPVIRYPITADVASGGDWQTGLTALQGQFVTSLLIDPAIDTAEVQEALADAGLLFITTKGYSSEAVREYWVATIGSDPIAGLKAAWPAVISGELDPSATAQVTVSGYNENLFSEAKLRLVNEAIQLLQDGSLVPGAVSLE
jgi:hypothetical protein